MTSEGEPVDLGAYKQRALLALLLVEANRVVSTDRLIDELWANDDGRDRQNALWVNISRLRTALEPDRQKRTDGTILLTQPPGYLLAVDAAQIDSSQFEALALEGRALLETDPASASLVLSEALALWRGRALEEFTYESFAQAEIARLEELRLAVVEDRVGADLRTGRSRELIGELESLVRQHPLRERLTEQLMVALHRSGRQPEALRTFASFQQRLGEELGLEPSAELTRLEERIVLDDPELRQPEAARGLGGRPEPGLSVRGYELRVPIGEGALGVVYRAYQPAVGREVAVKVIRPELANDPDFIRRFEAEARQVAHLEHPRIVPLFDYWREPDAAYLVMRHFAHGNLQDLLDRGPLSTETAVGIIDHVGGALAAAHRGGVVHGKVEPTHVLIDGDGNAYLGDFGMTLAGDSHAEATFLAPERHRGTPPTRESDIFALGVLTRLALRGSTGTDDWPDSPLVGPAADVVAQATADEPGARFPDVESFLDALHAALGAAAATTAPEHGDVENPYRGLRAFGENDAGRFHGRERLVERLIARLGHGGPSGRMVAVVGPSGAGKSSVVRAGLIPALQEGALPGSDRWFIVTMTPGPHPFESLEDALMTVAVDPPASLLDRLTSDGIAGAVASLMPEPGSQLVIVVDQLEELFSHTSPQESDEFLSALADAAADRHSAVKIVATLRADFYDRPLRHAAFGELLRLGTEVITPMTAEELERAIAAPAESVGISFEAGLVARIVADMTGQSAALPLMQYALTELFERRTATSVTGDAYQELGGVSAALVRRADSLYEGLDTEAQSRARDVFLRLVTLGEGTDDTRRRALLGELTDAGSDNVAEVVETFGRHRLLSFDRDPVTRGPTVEIAHEALLVEWRRLGEWIDDARADIHAQRRLATAAADWRERDHDPDYLLAGARFGRYAGWLEHPPVSLTGQEEQFLTACEAAIDAEQSAERRRVRRLRRLVAGVGVALVVALVAGGVALNQRNQANASADEARAAVDEAELATIISRSAAEDDPVLALLLALESHRRVARSDTEQAVLNALGTTKIASLVASRPRLDGCAPFAFIPPNSKGMAELATVDGRLISREPLSGVVTDQGPAPAVDTCVIGGRSSELGIAGSLDGLRAWFGPNFELALEFDQPTLMVLGTEDRFVTFEPTGPEQGQLMVLDGATGEQIGPILEGELFFGADTNADGSIIAVSFVRPNAPEGDGLIVFLDAETGEELAHLDLADGAEAIAFDPTSGHLLAGLLGGRLLGIDPTTADIVSDVQTAAGSFRDLGVRPDGLVVAVSFGQMETVDRFTGPTGVSSSLPDAEDAHVRPDGTVLQVTSAGRLEVFDFEGSALIEQQWDVDSSAWVAFGGDRAGAVNPARQEAGIVDLESGERTGLELVTPEGEPFRALTVYPEPDGAWAVSLDHEAARFVDGRMVEQLHLGSDESVVGVRAGRGVTGTRLGDRYAVVGQRPDGRLEASLVSLEPGGAEVLFTTPVGSATATHPTLDGGLHVIDASGVLRTYDAAGARIGEIATGTIDSLVITLDPSSGTVAVASDEGGVTLVDPASGEVEKLLLSDRVVNLAFARDGALLVMVQLNGDVRLWDVERGTSAGLLWDGTGGLEGEPPIYDATTDSIWVNSSGKLLQVPLSPASWVRRACELASRDLTSLEWERLVPGDEPRQSACN